MRNRAIPVTTRLLLIIALAVGGAAPIHASAQSNNPPEMAPRERVPVVRPDNRVERRPVKHLRKPEAHKAEPHPARPPEEKNQAKAPATPPAAAIPPAVKPTPPQEAGEPPAKIPRFAALKTDDTNMRKGPGQRYPIEWVYKRHDLPMEVEREYDVWRYVRDPDGIEGWVHQVTLSDRRTFIVQNQDATLRADAKDTASPVATLKVGVIGRLRECDAGSAWCQVQVGGYKGYLRRDQFWGLLPDEVVTPG